MFKLNLLRHLLHLPKRALRFVATSGTASNAILSYTRGELTIHVDGVQSACVSQCPSSLRDESRCYTVNGTIGSLDVAKLNLVHHRGNRKFLIPHHLILLPEVPCFRFLTCGRL